MSRRTLETCTFILLIVASVLVNACASGVQVSVNETNLDLLQGRWEGELISRGTDGNVYFQTTVALEIREGNGKLTLGTGSSWALPVRARGGKVLLFIDYSTHEFTLTRDSDGRFQLSATYGTKWQQWDQINTVSLVKK